MPELPEVETVRRGLAPVMEGARVEKLELRRKDLRFPFPDNFAKIVNGQRIVSLGRRVKYLLADLEDGNVIIMHLGMSGSFRAVEADDSGQYGNFHHERTRKPAHDHVTFHLITKSGSKAKVIYNDPRRFGFMALAKRAELDEHPYFVNMGVEPVGNALDNDELARKLAGKKAPLKAALLDQRVIAGLGNIYVCEALWRAGLSPTRQSHTIVLKNGQLAKRAENLVDHIRQVIADAIEAGGSSLKDHAATDGSLGYFQHQFAAYDRKGKPCRKEDCKGIIERIVQSGRSTFYCPECQK